MSLADAKSIVKAAYPNATIVTCPDCRRPILAIDPARLPEASFVLGGTTEEAWRDFAAHVQAMALTA